MTRFIIIEDYHGMSREADTEAVAEECIKELIDEVAYECGSMEDATGYVRVYEIKQEWEYQSHIKLLKPITSTKKGK
jgi:hypothetical protein